MSAPDQAASSSVDIVALSVGDCLPETVLTPSRTDFVKFAGAGGDFNPVHHDDVYAKSLGYPTVFAMGMWTASIAARTVTEIFGTGALRTYSVRFAAPVWPDQAIRFQTRVAEKRSTAEGHELDLVLTVLGDTEAKLHGKATVTVRRNRPFTVPGQQA